MADRLTIDGESVIEEDDSTGDITVSLDNLNIGPDADFAIEYSPDGLGRLYFQNGDALFFIQDDRVQFVDAYLSMANKRIEDVTYIEMEATDVRTITTPEASLYGSIAYHDGSGANTEGPAHYTSADEWVSTVDGTTIS